MPKYQNIKDKSCWECQPLLSIYAGNGPQN